MMTRLLTHAHKCRIVAEVVSLTEYSVVDSLFRPAKSHIKSKGPAAMAVEFPFGAATNKSLSSRRQF